MNTRRLTASLCILAILLTAQTLGAEERIFLLRNSILHVISPIDGREITQIEAAESDRVLPTPGGKYIFLVNSESGNVSAVDFEDPSKTKRIDLSDLAPLALLAFSPTGDYFYAARLDTSTVNIYNHKAGVINKSGSFELPKKISNQASQLTFNIRGTRFYQTEDSNQLIYRLSKDAAEIRRVKNIPGAGNWQMAPNGRYLWTNTPSGWIVVDEARGKVINTIKGSGVSSLHFDSKGRKAYALSDQGATITILNTRRNNKVEVIRPNLEKRILDLALTESGDLWLMTKNTVLRMRSDEIEPELMMEFADESDSAELHYVRLKTGEGFACF